MSILHMVKCPPTGGDTMWTSLYAAFEELSEPLQDLCLGLTALHDALPHNHPEQMAIHPVVREHPETGRSALYVNEHFTRRIVEMNAPERDILGRDDLDPIAILGQLQGDRFLELPNDEQLLDRVFGGQSMPASQPQNG